MFCARHSTTPSARTLLPPPRAVALRSRLAHSHAAFAFVEVYDPIAAAHRYRSISRRSITNICTALPSGARRLSAGLRRRSRSRGHTTDAARFVFTRASGWSIMRPANKRCSGNAIFLISARRVLISPGSMRSIYIGSFAERFSALVAAYPSAQRKGLCFLSLPESFFLSPTRGI